MYTRRYYLIIINTTTTDLKTMRSVVVAFRKNELLDNYIIMVFK